MHDQSFCCATLILLEGIQPYVVRLAARLKYLPQVTIAKLIVSVNDCSDNIVPGTEARLAHKLCP